jgi:ABC-type Na+ transport system ATPase subunit NatA
MYDTSPPGSIQVDALRKTFPKGDKPAPGGVDLRVDAGRVCALLGANGAGSRTGTRSRTDELLERAGLQSLEEADELADDVVIPELTGVTVAADHALLFAIGWPLAPTLAFVPRANRAYRRLS